MSDEIRELLAKAEADLKRADRLLNVSMAAKRLNRCTESVRRYIRTGKLHAIRPPGGGRLGNYLIPESSIKRFLQHDAT